MKTERKKQANLGRRRLRVRRKLSAGAGRPRLVVYRSLAHIYAQIVDDATGETLAAASTVRPKLRSGLKSTGNIEAAKVVGKVIAAHALARDVKKVRFDRGGRKYHGRVKALAEAAREAGLDF